VEKQENLSIATIHARAFPSKKIHFIKGIAAASGLIE